MGLHFYAPVYFLLLSVPVYVLVFGSNSYLAFSKLWITHENRLASPTAFPTMQPTNYPTGLFGEKYNTIRNLNYVWKARYNDVTIL